VIPVLVTTEYRGVFFGYVESREQAIGRTVSLKSARNCLYWSSDVRGFLGLAANGPNKECRIGPKVPSLVLRAVTAVAEVTPESAEQWERAPWRA
jgi:hypothetical protein